MSAKRNRTRRSSSTSSLHPDDQIRSRACALATARLNASRKKPAGLLAAGLVAIALLGSQVPSTAWAEDIETLLPYVIDNHDRLRAQQSRLTAARNRAREALGDWYPTLSQTLNAGTERQQNDNGDDSSTGFNEWDISLTQLLWDFGSTNASIDKARLQVEEARLTLIETRQSLILEAITAYMNLIRAHQSLKFAIQSEDNIRKQTGLEEALVGLGSGFSTDVLQAKSQLAGAQARRATSEGALSSALNRYKAVFGRVPDNIDALETVPFPAPFLPTSLTQATDIALEMNPALKNAILAADIAMEDLRIARADNFAPRIEATGERKFKKNVGGTIGSEQETLAKVEMTFDFNLGFTAVNTLKAAKEDLSASTYSAADTRRNIDEQVRNAWQQLDTAKRTASHLDNQSHIEAAFLELARNERQLGRRSLIDVLSGETTLINAKSDALSARTDVVIAAYGLLSATGLLQYDVISQSKGIEPPIAKPDAVKKDDGIPDAAPVPAVTPAPAPASNQEGSIYSSDTALASARSAADLRAMMSQASLGQTRAKTADIKNSVPPGIEATTESAALTFDTSALDAAESDLAHSLAVAPEFASTETVTELAPDIPVVPDIADTASRLAVLREYEADIPRPVAQQTDTDIDIDVQVAADIPDMPDVLAMTAEVIDAPPLEAQPETTEVAAVSEPTDTGDFLSNLFGKLEEAHRAYEADLPARDTVEVAAIATPEAAVDTAQPDTAEPVATVETPKTTNILSEIFNALETAHVAYEADVPEPQAPIVEQAALSPAEDIAPHRETQADEPLGGLFSFFEQAHQRRLESDAAKAAGSVKPIVARSTVPTPVRAAALEPDPSVPETLADAISETVKEVAETIAPAATPVTTNAPVEIETASVSHTSTGTETTEPLFGNIFDFLEQAHQRKLEADAIENTDAAAPKSPQPVAALSTAPTPASAPTISADQSDTEFDGQESVEELVTSISSLFAGLGNVDLTYRPLSDDERTNYD